MSLECLTWIPHLWDKLICLLNVRKDSFAMQDFPKEILICSLNVRKDDFSMQDLPEEILIDILSRLPGNCVLERRRVCKQWLALTSTPNFFEMHLKRATPVLFMQLVDHIGKMDMFIFDEGAKANQMIKKMGAKFMHVEAPHVPDLCGSCNGLLLFHSISRSYIPSSLSLVCNPLTGEKVTIRTPVDPVIVCGIFYHPLTNDYKLLFVYYKIPFSTRESVDIKYFLYSLRGQCWRKLDDFPYLPNVVAPPAILNGAVHWMVDRSLNEIPPYGSVGASVTSIMIFNMDTEEFRRMPHPRLECPVWKVGKYIRLFEMKGKLAFCLVLSSHVYLWVLEDYENWIWGERYLVNLNLYVKRYPLDITHIGPGYTGSLITVVDIQNDELLFDYRSRGLFRYNLRQKTIKQINAVGMKQMPLLPFSNCKRCLIPYTKTFVSPSGFK